MQLTWLWVFLGGGLGALARFALGQLLPRIPGGMAWATLAVNLTGAFLIGLLAGYLMARSGLRAFWLVGVLGGFTTFSAFSFETLDLLHQRGAALALTYVGLTLGLGLMACWGGLKISGHA